MYKLHVETVAKVFLPIYINLSFQKWLHSKFNPGTPGKASNFVSIKAYVLVLENQNWPLHCNLFNKSDSCIIKYTHKRYIVYSVFCIKSLLINDRINAILQLLQKCGIFALISDKISEGQPIFFMNFEQFWPNIIKHL